MSRLQQSRIPGLLRRSRFFRLFRRAIPFSPIPGNRVSLLPDGGEFFRTLLEEIDRAASLLLLEFYIVRGDAAGRIFADALITAARRGVRVFLIYDYIGSFDTPADYFRTLRESGVTCLAFNPPSFRWGLARLDKRDHRKMAVIDGIRALVGGGNIGNEYSGHGKAERWRDAGVLIEGPAVAELQRLFTENWEQETGSLLTGCRLPGAPLRAGDADVIIVSGGPSPVRSTIRRAYRFAIAGATESVRVMTPYFLPGPRIIRSLLRAIRRGVQVQLILPAVNDVPIVRLLSRGYYHPVLTAGITIHERQKEVLHAKVMLIDDHWSVFGSANMDHRSFSRNYEISVIIDNGEFGEQVARMIDHDLERSREITLDEHERRGWLMRFLEALFSPIARFL